MNPFQKLKLAAAVAKIALGGKSAKTLETIEGGLEVAEKIKALLPKKQKRKVSPTE